MESMTTSAVKDMHPRVAQDLQKLRQAVCRSVPDVEALILTGSFAHGEGSFQRTEKGLQPFNDYDVVVVAKTEPDSLVLRERAASISSMLGMRGVDLLGVGLHRFAWLPPSIFNYDLRHGGHVFHGNPDLLGTLPDWQPTDIPLIEAQVLLLNRMICLLESVEDGPEVPAGEEEATRFLTFQTAKAAFALADSVALLHGTYAVLYVEKQEALKGLVPAQSDVLELVDAAWRFRQDLDPQSLGISPAEFWMRTRAALLRTFLYLMNWMYARGRPFESPRELAHFLSNYPVWDSQRAAIAAAQYLTLAAWDSAKPDTGLLSLAQVFLTKAGATCSDSTWPTVRRTVVAAWFRYCH
jgi:hypothetical protein